MTQLIIDGHEAVLPQKFSTTVKRENSFFTKNGEYTYDVTLNLDNPVNCQLFEFLNRLNKSEQIETKRTATLIADGHVYTRGTEIVTRWTDDSVTIQIVSGESELNYFIGQDQKIEDLDLGEVTEDNCCYPTVRTKSGNTLNAYLFSRNFDTGNGEYWNRDPVAQPYLLTIIEAIIKALGYNKDVEFTNHLRNTHFKYAFLVNTLHTTKIAEMVKGWTVKDFMTEVEKLTGCVFVTNNVKKTCSILLKTIYYQEAKQFTVRNVIDAYEANVQDEEGREAEFSSSDVSYDMPDHRWSNFMKLPEDLMKQATIVDVAGLSELQALLNSSDAKSKIIYRISSDQDDPRYYIIFERLGRTIHFGGGGSSEDETKKERFILEVNAFADLDRENSTSTLELKITPAPMTYLKGYRAEVIDLGSSDGYGSEVIIGDEDEEDETGEEAEDQTFEDVIRDYSSEDSSPIDLYCALCKDVNETTGMPIAYTDAYHATTQVLLWQLGDAIGDPEGSLRLQWLDSSYFQGGYEIDTRHAVTFETYDPNVIDPRQVYVIRNKRYVCRDVEEVITAEGRQAKWKGTFFPIHVSDEALLKKWVLTHGVWDDGAAWLDDGRWIDDYDGAVI